MNPHLGDESPETHIATGLGHAAVSAGYRVYLTSAPDLAARCHRAAIEGK